MAVSAYPIAQQMPNPARGQASVRVKAATVGTFNLDAAGG
jgi:hypothetical protein